MNPSLIVAALLALAVSAGIWRARRRQHLWSDAAVWLQPLSAIAFYCLLFPPAVPVPADTLMVLTPAAVKLSTPWLRPVVALPDTRVSAAIESAPDLATALRRHPQTQTLLVKGDGLPARDREAVGTLGLHFDAAAEHGLLELNLPSKTQLGTQWPLSGRVASGVAQLELHDPSRAIADSTVPDADGRFTLSGLARAPGASRFELRLLDAEQKLIETASVPIDARGGEPLSVILRVGAPDAEFKYWRRWASDAGIALRVRAGLSEKVDLRDGDTALTPPALAQTDLVIIDERAWLLLGADEKAALSAAVRDGLGLLLRIDGPVDAAVAADWAALGVKLQPADTLGVTLDRRTGLRDRTGFTTAPASATLADGIKLLQADDGEALASWRNEGRGRIAVWNLLDSYRLSLLGEGARYGALWSQTISTLARPRAAAEEPQLPAENWIDERAVLCGLGTSASVAAPDGSRSDLQVDDKGCAAIWPAQAGWHRVQTAGTESSFYVRAGDDAVSLRAARDRRETQRLVREPASDAKPSSLRIPLPRWPLLLLWLLIAGLLWWRERPGTG